MTVTATVRYHNKNGNRITFTREVPPETTAGALSKSVLAALEKQEHIHFTGANIVVLIEGRIAADERLLQDGDEILIIPVAAGG